VVAVDDETALSRARVVFAALGQAVAPRELDDLVSELPRDYNLLLPRGPHAEVMPAAAFVSRVAERAALDVESARRASMPCSSAGRASRRRGGRRPHRPSRRRYTNR
jgi:hypothetical protein